MKMKKTKWLALLTMLAMMLTLFAACGGNTEPPAPAEPADSGAPAASEPATEGGASPEAVEISLATWDYTSNESVSNAVKAFEAANPHISVNVIDVPSTDYNTKLNVMLNGGSELDAYFIKDASSTFDLYEKGQLLDLSDFISADGIDMSVYSGTDAPFNIEGRQYGMPVRTDYYVLYYNKAIFDAAGMDYPSNDMTWDEFEQLAMDISGDGVYGAFFHTWQACVENWGIQDGKNTILDYQSGYDFFKPYYDMVIRLQKAGAVQDFGEIQSGNIHYSGAFATGNVAMMPMGSWYMATAIDAVKNGETQATEWAIATLPHPADVSAGYTVGATTPIVINPASDKQEAAWELVKFISGDEGANEYAKVGAIPGRLSDDVIANVASQAGMPEGTAEALKVKNIVADRPIAAGVVEVNNMLGEEHSLIMLEEVTVDEGLATMAERAEEILAEING